MRAHAGVWEISEAVRKSLENESGKLRRLVRALEEERDFKSVFFFFVIPTLKHIRNWLEGPPLRKVRIEIHET